MFVLEIQILRTVNAYPTKSVCVFIFTFLNSEIN